MLYLPFLYYVLYIELFNLYYICMPTMHSKYGFNGSCIILVQAKCLYIIRELLKNNVLYIYIYFPILIGVLIIYIFTVQRLDHHAYDCYYHGLKETS